MVNFHRQKLLQDWRPSWRFHEFCIGKTSFFSSRLIFLFQHETWKFRKIFAFWKVMQIYSHQDPIILNYLLNCIQILLSCSHRDQQIILCNDERANDEKRLKVLWTFCGWRKYVEDSIDFFESSNYKFIIYILIKHVQAFILFISCTSLLGLNSIFIHLLYVRRRKLLKFKCIEIWFFCFPEFQVFFICPALARIIFKTMKTFYSFYAIFSGILHLWINS